MLTFIWSPPLFSLGSQSVRSTSRFGVALPFSVNPFWKHHQTYLEVCLPGDSKSSDIESEDESSQEESRVKKSGKQGHCADSGVQVNYVVTSVPWQDRGLPKDCCRCYLW